MKYIKYKRLDKVSRYADNLFLDSFRKKEAKKYKRKRFLKEVILLFACILFFALIGLSAWIIHKIPIPENIFLAILTYILDFILFIVFFVISFLLILYPIVKLTELNYFNIPKTPKTYISKASKLIRKYYGFNEDYLLTKCFYSTNDKFINHDICIFRYDDEIRITGDIVTGYKNYNAELGCYKIKLNEITIKKEDYNNKRVTIIEFCNVKFIVGIRAYSFIKRLLNIKIYKYLYKKIETHNEYINFIIFKKSKKIMLKDIKNIEINIPQYDGIPGSFYDYTYEFIVYKFDENEYNIHIVLNRNEEKEILEYFENNNIKFIIKYIDNVPREGSGD